MSTELQYTPLPEVKAIYERLTATFKSGVTRPIAYRRKQLLQLGRMLQENHAAFEDAFHADFNKPRLEITAEDIAPPIPSIINAIEKLEEWTRPEKPTVEAWRSTWDTTLHKVPKGVALIISPFNYPYILSFNPMVGAIAAGCPVVLKPSEANPNASALMTKLVPKYLDPNAYAVVNGGPEETTALLELRWDHIFFTGGTRVGQIVAAAAAKHITPVTLELGGKSPVIIDTDCDIDLAAKRVLFGKLQNMGQLCASPDYVLVPRSVAPAFRESLLKWYKTFWPDGPLHESSQWGKIVNSAHHQRLKRLLEQSKGEIIIGGEVTDDRRIAPTIINGITSDDALMQEENFGPILPLIEVEDVDEAITFIGKRQIPLVLYAFTRSEDTKRKVLEKTSSGRVSFNDTFSLLMIHEIPFGGHGHSGYGSYFGKHTFDVFTHFRGSIDVPAEEEPSLEDRYPPYTEKKYESRSKIMWLPLPEA